MAGNGNNLIFRDGAGRNRRRLPALSPDYFLLDEREHADLLRYLQGLAGLLRYPGPDGALADNWSAFLQDLSANVTLRHVLDYLREPDAFARDPFRRQWLSRPHFALLLTFLELLTPLRRDLNQFTRRHLDYYYREVLGVTLRPAEADRVHVLLELARGAEPYPLPAGALLQAGKDDDGRPRFYETLQQIVVNRAQVAELKTLVVDRERKSLKAYHNQRIIDGDTEPFPDVLQVVYHDDNGALLPFSEQAVNLAFFRNYLLPLFDFSPNQLFLSLSELRRLMRLKKRRDADLPDWDEINNLLTQAGKKKNTAWQPNAALNPRDFRGRFLDALGFDPLQVDANNPLQKKLQGVDDLLDLFEQLEEELARQAAGDAFDQARLTAFETFARDNLFLPLDAFRRMMGLLESIRRDWEKINAWLTRAGAAKRRAAYAPGWPDLPAFPDFPDVDARLRTALSISGQLPKFFRAAAADIGGLDDYWNALTTGLGQRTGVEQYFNLPVEDARFIISTALNPSAPDADWDRVYPLLEQAFREQELARGRRQLQLLREGPGGFIAMMKYAFGEPAGEDLPDINNKKTTPEILEELRVRSTITDRYLEERLSLSRVFFDELMNVAYPPAGSTPGPDDWLRVYRFVEEARRLRRGLPAPAPVSERLHGLFSFADATRAVAPEQDGGHWRTFGQRDGAAAAPTGLAICSSLLNLEGGSREISLHLGFSAPLLLPAGGMLSDYFDFQLSAGEKWLSLTATTKVKTNTHSLVLTLGPDLPAVKAPAAGTFPGDPKQPVLQMTLHQPSAPMAVHPYEVFKDAILETIRLEVEVAGLTPAQLENEVTVLDPKKPGELFGPSPRPGSALFLAHPEWCFKPLQRVGVHLDWKGILGSLSAHYANYGTAPAEGAVYAALKCLKGGKLLNPGGKDLRVGLFPNNQNDGAKSYEGRKYNTYDFALTEEENPLAADAPARWSRYFRLELETDFLHGAYPGLAAGKAMEFALAVRSNTPPANANAYKLNPPYTPDAKSFYLYYKAGVDLLDTQGAFAPGHYLWQLHPFGYLPVVRENRTADPIKAQVYLLPDHPNVGELYLGLEGLEPPRQIHLLWQMAEGSADPDLEKAEVAWSYLTATGWQPFGKGDILADETNGLGNSGILQLAVPADAVADSPLLPAGKHWLRASVTDNRYSVCDVIGVFPQAVTARRILTPESADDPGRPLPPDTIKAFYDRQPGIRKARQPFASFGGRSSETDGDFYTRLSERLRHKQRALTMWDVEHLLLEQFPDIVYKVKCLPVSEPDGEVSVIVVPDIRGKTLYDPFAPKVPVNRLDEIETYLNEHGALPGRFRVVNPRYVTLQVKAYVQFRPGYDLQFYQHQLEEDLKRFLAPWAYDEGADIAINSTVYPSVIINFMEERPYVDYVAGVRLFQSLDGIRFTEADADRDGILPADRPDTIWVSARRHFIELAELRPDLASLSYEGVGYMQVEYDFTVS